MADENELYFILQGWKKSQHPSVRFVDKFTEGDVFFFSRHLPQSIGSVFEFRAPSFFFMLCLYFGDEVLCLFTLLTLFELLFLFLLIHLRPFDGFLRSGLFQVITISNWTLYFGHRRRLLYFNALCLFYASIIYF